MEDLEGGARRVWCEDDTEFVLQPGDTGPAGEEGRGCAIEQGPDGLRFLRCEDESALVIDREGNLLRPFEGVLQGSFEIRNSLDLVLLSGVEEVTGNLTFFADGLGDIALPLLHRVRGHLQVRGFRGDPEDEDAIATLALPLLERVGGDLWIGTQDDANNSREGVLGGLDAPLLESVGGNLRVFTSAAMTLTLPELTEVGGDLWLWSERLVGVELPALRQVDELFDLGRGVRELSFPALESVGGILQFGSQERVSLPELVELGGISLSPNVIEDIEWPKLDTVTGTVLIFRASQGSGGDVLDFGGLRYVDGDVRLLTEYTDSVRFPNLEEVTGNFEVAQWPRMTTLEVPLLERVGGDMTVRGSRVVTLTLPSLEEVEGEFLIASSALINILRAPALARVGGDFRVLRGFNMEEIDVPALTEVGGDCVVPDGFGEVCP